MKYFEMLFTTNFVINKCNSRPYEVMPQISGQMAARRPRRTVCTNVADLLYHNGTHCHRRVSVMSPDPSHYYSYHRVPKTSSFTFAAMI